MSLFFVLLLMGVVTAIAVVAAGRGGSMERSEADRSPYGLLPAGDVSLADLTGLRFSLVFRGYRMDEVDAVLDRVARELAARDQRIAERESTPGQAVRADEPARPDRRDEPDQPDRSGRHSRQQPAD